MPTDYEKLASDIMSGKPNAALNGKSDELKKLTESADAQKVKQMLGGGDAVKKAMESGDSAALESIVKNVLSTKEGAKLASELAKMFNT